MNDLQRTGRSPTSLPLFIDLENRDPFAEEATTAQRRYGNQNFMPNSKWGDVEEYSPE